MRIFCYNPFRSTLMALWCSRLARQPVTLEVDGSSPFGVAIKKSPPSGGLFFMLSKKRTRKPALGNLPVAGCNRRGFSAEKRVRSGSFPHRTDSKAGSWQPAGGRLQPAWLFRRKASPFGGLSSWDRPKNQLFVTLFKKSLPFPKTLLYNVLITQEEASLCTKK